MRRVLLFSIVLCVLGCIPAVAVPRAGYGKPIEHKSSDAPVPLGTHFTSSDLARVTIGNQAGILKIVGADGQVLFMKDAPNVSMQGIDGTLWAPVSEKHREAIFKALCIEPGEVGAVAQAIMRNFERLRRAEAIALLGVLGSVPDAHVSSVDIRRFLAQRLQGGDVRTHRLAVLSLALDDEMDYETVDCVLDFLQGSHNAWETFTTQQFFEYHRAWLRACPQASQVCRRVEASGNPYAPQILSLLR